MTAEGKGAVVAVAATLAMAPADSSGGNGGAGKNGGGRRKQRQQRGQTTINQKAAAIAAETAIVAAAETAGTETAAAETAVAETAVGGGGGSGANSGRGGNRCGGSRRNAIVNQSVVCFRKYCISGSTLTRKCLPTYIEFYLCICKFLFVAQIKVPLWSFCNVYLVFTNKTTFRTKQIHIRRC
jgi:hypothetical protein